MSNSNAIVIRLAGEPRGKGRAQFSRRTGRAYTPARTVSYEAALRIAAQAVMRGAPLAGPLDVTVTMHMPVPASWSKKKQLAALAGEIFPTKKPDWDNAAKMTDALNQVVWIDDKQIVDGRVRKRYSATPELIVSVLPLGE